MTLPPELLQTISDSRARVRFSFPWWLRPFLMRGVDGITIGRRIYMNCEDETLLRHELVHVRQIARVGVIRFYSRYVVEYIRNRRRGMSSHDAYAHISFEKEALDAESPILNNLR